MEMEKAASWWNKLPFDFQVEICARMAVEFVHSYRMICKQWNDFLSSNYFLTRWGDASLNNGNQTRLLVCDFSMKTPCMAFCFYTRTWINSCLDLSFLKDGDWRDIGYFKQSVGGLILVTGGEFGYFYNYRRLCNPYTRLCNPYTRTFVEIPAPHASRYSDCIVVDEKDNGTTYKVAAVGTRWSLPLGRQQLVEIYEPSQKGWKIAGYLPENVRLQTFAKLFYCNGTFYTHCLGQDAGRQVGGIGCFTIPLEEGSGSEITPNPIPMHFAPFPRKLRKGIPHWRMITCLSRLLVISANHVSVRRHAGGQRKRKVVDVFSVWELKFNSEEGHRVPLSNSPAWEWVKIAQMPSPLCREWMAKIGRVYYSGWDCRGVGHHVCFAHSLFGNNSQSRSRDVIAHNLIDDIITYNLIDNTWSWLPSCPFSKAAEYGAIDVDPNLLIKVP